jgi:hypothetical protein
MFRLLLLALIPACVAPPALAETALIAGATFAAHDTLDPGVESSADAKACLDLLIWQDEDFHVRCEHARERCGDLMIQR